MSDMVDWFDFELDKYLEYQTQTNKESCFIEALTETVENIRKAVPLLVEGQSGYSIGIVKNIVDRILLNKPLTPIFGTDDEWGEADHSKKDGTITYQNKRYSALFKHVHTDGSVSYNDVDRVNCYDVGDPIPYHCGDGDRIVNELYPITFPYVPMQNGYKVYCETFLYDKKNGDFDTHCIKYIVIPNGKKVKVNRYYGETKSGWKQLGWFEYMWRKLRRVR